MQDLNVIPDQKVSLWCEFRKLAGNNNSPVDRFGSIDSPFRFELATTCKMPEVPPSFNKTYEDICSERAREILALQDRNKKKICIPYSGGIDSTMVIIAFLKELRPDEVRDRLLIYLNRNSINENPVFYQKYIRNDLSFTSSERLWEIFDGNNIYVSGDFNDQLLGSWVVQEVGHLVGEEAIALPYNRDLILKVLRFKGMSNEGANFWYEALVKNISKQTVTDIKTVNDFFWWTSFNFKWQAVYFGVVMRTLPFSHPLINSTMLEECFQPFFMAPDFQRWAVHHPELKIQNSWRSYKWHVKDLIFDFNKDAQYRDEKIKVGSLYHILMQNNAPTALTSKFEFLQGFDATEFLAR